MCIWKLLRTVTEAVGFRTRLPGVQSLALPLWVVLREFLNLALPQGPNLKKGDNNSINFIGVIVTIK